MSITEYPKNHHGISKKNIPCFGNDKEWPKEWPNFFDFEYFEFFRLFLLFQNEKFVFFRPVHNSSFSPPYRGIYTILFDSRCYNGFFALDARKIHYSAARDIIHVDYNTAAALHYTYKHWYNSARPKPLRK